MSESPAMPAPISTDQMDRIKQDALRGIGASSGDTLRLIAENARQLDQVAALRNARIPAGLYTELAALRDLRNQVKAYIDGYLQDEVADVEACISDDQHLSASMLNDLLEAAFAAYWDSTKGMQQ